jgi:hypothetical protein
MKRIVVIALAVTFALTQFSSLNAQFEGSGTITGTIDGPQGPLTGVTVQAIDSAGSIAGSAVTNGTGAFRIGALRAGTYTVRVLGANGQVIATSSATLTAETMTATLKLSASAGALAGPASGVPAAANGGGMSAKVVLASVGAAAASLGTLLVISTNEDVSGSR